MNLEELSESMRKDAAYVKAEKKVHAGLLRFGLETMGARERLKLSRLALAKRIGATDRDLMRLEHGRGTSLALAQAVWQYLAVEMQTGGYDAEVFLMSLPGADTAATSAGRPGNARLANAGDRTALPACRGRGNAVVLPTATRGA